MLSLLALVETAVDEIIRTKIAVRRLKKLAVLHSSTFYGLSIRYNENNVFQEELDKTFCFEKIHSRYVHIKDAYNSIVLKH